MNECEPLILGLVLPSIKFTEVKGCGSLALMLIGANFMAKVTLGGTLSHSKQTLIFFWELFTYTWHQLGSIDLTSIPSSFVRLWMDLNWCAVTPFALQSTGTTPYFPFPGCLFFQ